MAWSIELRENVRRELRKYDPQIAKRILKFLHDRVAKLDNPRSIGEALRGSQLGDYWKYRVGDWRIICDIQDDKLVVLVLNIGNRREIYER
jgi:mRNA interferase RelE/StbE